MNIAQPGSHLDHLLRQTRWHHAQLSSMADTKANMMLTVASLVITLSVRYLVEPLLRWAALTLIAFCLLTIVMSAYAAMPKLALSLKPAPSANVHSPAFNLLFFGDFVHLSYPEFEAAMEEVMNDSSRTYEAQVREVYYLGVFLARNKYRFVRLAYISFIAGLLAGGVVLLLTAIG